MEKKIIFCNIAWMKDYRGKTDEDIPINGGKYIDEVGTGGEVCSFLDDNGKCHGLVRIKGKIALQNHFKGVKLKDEYVDDVLVVWVATNEKKQTRIVGWYKNARVYRENRELIFFTEQSSNQYYNVEAKTTDCFLLPVEDRTFEINRASEVGVGMGMGQSNIWYAESTFARANIVPAVIKYIENYDGNNINFVYDDWDIENEINDIKFSNDFGKLYEKGLESYEKKSYYEALIYFKAAQKIDEPIEMLRKLGKTLFYTLRYDEAVDLFKRIIDLEGVKIDLLVYTMQSYDLTENREKTIEYANKVIELPSNDYNAMEDKINAYCIIFNICIYEKKFKKAEEIMGKLQIYLKENAEYSTEDTDRIINQMQENIRVSVENLIR